MQSFLWCVVSNYYPNNWLYQTNNKHLPHRAFCLSKHLKLLLLYTVHVWVKLHTRIRHYIGLLCDVTWWELSNQFGAKKLKSLTWLASLHVWFCIHSFLSCTFESVIIFWQDVLLCLWSTHFFIVYKINLHIFLYIINIGF